jgi:lipoprotein LprG
MNGAKMTREITTLLRSGSIWLIALAAGLVLVASACRSADDEVEHDADALISGATERFRELESARYSLELDGSVALDARGLFLLRGAEGEIARPGSATAETHLSLGGANVTLQLISIDGEMYLRNVVTGQWERAPVDLQYDPAIVFDEGAGVTSVLEQVENRAVDATETVNGVETVKVTGSVATEAVRRMTGDVFESDVLDVTLWIDPDQHDIHRIQLDDPENPEAPSWALLLTGHDEPVEITAPDVG